MNREYEVTITSWPDLAVVVAAATAQKAKSDCWQDAKDAGWDIPYINFRAKLVRSKKELKKENEELQ